MRVSNPKYSPLYYRLNWFPGKLLRVKKLFPRTVEECIAHYNRVGDKDIAAAAAFIRRCLTIDPSVRPNASELLHDEWLIDI
jgi:serine/threonine-protein kinase SRPK3